jgi:hypothetical protein
LAAPSAAEGRLSRPGLKEKLRPVGANVRSRGIRGCDPEKQESGIRIVGIGRDVAGDCRPGCSWRMLCQPSLALHDPFQNLALGQSADSSDLPHQVYCQLIRSVGAKLFFLPKCFTDLNPIEQVFAKLKHFLRKAAARTVEAVCFAIGEVLQLFTPEECARYLVNSGY